MSNAPFPEDAVPRDPSAGSVPAGSGSLPLNVSPSEAEELEREIAEAMQDMSSGGLDDLARGAAPSSAHAPHAGLQFGRIVAVQGEDVFVDLGGKTQGVIPKSQFKPEEKLAVGEPLEVFVDRYDRASDLLILTRKGAARSVEWDLLRPGDIVEGRVVGLNRGGLEVQLKGVRAFMPASQVDVMHVKDISIFLNEPVKCQVLEIDRRGRSLTVSRRKIVEKERAAKRVELLAELEVGQVRKGVVGNLTEFGAFVDLGGVDGLVHISDLSWRPLKHASEVVNTGDVVEVKVLKIQGDGEKQRISLGLKQALPDPWHDVESRFPVNSNHRVRVLRIVSFGAFAELVEGVEGLIPISEMAWSRINNPAEVVEVGQLVDAVVIRVEADKRRIALSIKQAQSDPWGEVLDSYQPDTMVDGRITKLTDFGAFVELAPGVEGLIHISELADRRIRTCAEVVKPGQEVKARVLKVDAPSRRISLSLRPSPQMVEAHEPPAEEHAAEHAKPKTTRKEKPRRGGLSSTWDWAGSGFGALRGTGGPSDEHAGH